MFQEVLPENALSLIDKIAERISGFYLAGGTGLALQLGHRVSEDLFSYCIVLQHRGGWNSLFRKV